MHSFFVVALPGLEDLALQELREWFPNFSAQVVHGGVEVQAPLEQGLAMNLALKVPTRILVRITHFTCRDFPKLFNKLKDFKWNEWVRPATRLDVRVATHGSRLKIKRRLEETCLAALKTFAEGDRSVTLFVRLQEDVCTLSFDTSGERLHKRGQRTHVGEAPLRETWAAALLQWMGDPPEGAELFDPMAGSGTFLLEARERLALSESREFAFAGLRSKSIVKPVPPAKSSFAKLIGFEADAKTRAAAQHNVSSADVRHADVFTARPLEPCANRWLIANPPWGERLEIREPLGTYYARLFEACERVARPERACFLLPRKVGRLLLPPFWKVVAKKPFAAGGLPVTAFLMERV